MKYDTSHGHAEWCPHFNDDMAEALAPKRQRPMPPIDPAIAAEVYDLSNNNWTANDIANWTGLPEQVVQRVLDDNNNQGSELNG